jgi:hypothetical protein
MRRYIVLISVLTAAIVLLAPSMDSWAQDKPLEELKAILIPLRSEPLDYSDDYRKVSTPLTKAKHQLRDWIESQLQSLDHQGDEKVHERIINNAIKSADLMPSSDEQNWLGYLGDVELTREDDLLILKTGVGILCQDDQSAYTYKWVDNRWKRIWEFEQTDYSPKKYFPQYIESIHEWRPYDYKNGRKTGERFFLSLGHEWGCASFWHNAYWKLWRIGSAGTKLLIDGSHWAYLRAGQYIIGSVAGDNQFSSNKADVLIEFTQDGIDSGVLVREGIRHYEVDRDNVRRIDPFALSPRDFADEWIQSAWSESADWSHSPALRLWHRKLYDGHFADFSPTMHCRTPDLWQVTITPRNSKKDFKDEPNLYFLVRWRPPYHFTMMNVSKNPWPLCKERDDQADEWRSLFWLQDWR